VRQAVLGILSQDLAAGARMPSVRAMARRHRIHSNTVSAAWHDLLDQGWLELRRGSGLYVKPLEPVSPGSSPLQALLKDTLAKAAKLGHSPEEALRGLSTVVHRRPFERVLVAESDPAMREILIAELTDALGCTVERFDGPAEGRGLIVALTTQMIRLRRGGKIPRGAETFALRLRSVDEALGEPQKPPPGFLIAIVSRSTEILDSAHAILAAVGVEPDALQRVDASEDRWRERLKLARLIVTDTVVAKQIPSGRSVRVFRVISDSSIEELKRLV
jgi:GntR family transcriptional regulator